MPLAMATPTTAAHLASPPLLPSFPTTPRRRHLAAPRRGARLASVPDPGAGPLEYTPWLIAGLGNPGAKYHGTRHNVGFEMVDRIAREEGVAMNTIQSKSLLGVGSVGDVPVLLVKPQSYMNYCGEAIGPLAAYYQVPLRHILVIYDETSLPNGVLRVQRKGGHGRHNGLQNVIENLDGCREFPRLSIGIGSPPGKMDARAFLLQKFSSEERVQIDTALEQGVDAVRTLVLKGFSGSIERFNLVQKYKFNRV
ncbi:chloroplastic group IIB intron splicing facilitator CRS2, chloroplastic-like [Lolium rigidum]|nr:chloroplastic group IIB intron splicing facilitator CRS2, chloroplastic-like [Lolium rigidum]